MAVWPVPRPASAPTAPRVLHLTAVTASNYYLNSLADQLHPGRVEFLAASLAAGGDFIEALRSRGVPAVALGPSRRFALPWTAIRVASLVAKSRTAIIHGHLFEPTLVAALASRLTGRPLVTTRHHSDAIHRLESRWRRAALLRAEAFTNKTASLIIAPAKMVERMLIEHEGVPAEKIRLVPYPQDEARFEGLRPSEEVRTELGASRARLLVCVSRLHPEKGLDVLLEAFALLLGDLQLRIAGTGPDRDRLETHATRIGVADRVRLLGWRDDALSILRAADVVVHPSLHEALPSAVIEALALGKPVVATDVSGVRDILGDQQYGRVVRPGDVSSLARALAETLAEPARVGAAASEGRQRLFEYMRPERVADAHLACYLRVQPCAG